MYWSLDQFIWRPAFLNRETNQRFGPMVWTLPDGATHALDLRPTARCATPGSIGVTAPLHLAVVASPVAPKTGTILMDDPQGTVVSTTLSILATKLGITFSSTKLVDVLWELLMVHADNVALCRWLMPTRSRTFELHLGPLSLSQPCVEGGPGWANVVKQHQADYALLNASADPKSAQRMLTVWMEKYGTQNFQQFIPAGLPITSPLPHSTTISENFNGADKSGVGYQLTWSVTEGAWHNISNTARQDSSGYASDTVRAESDLSTVDMECQADVVSPTNTSFSYGGTCVRFATAANTFYEGQLACNDNYYLVKEVATTRTTLLNTATGDTLTPPFTMKTRISGTTLTIYEAGVSKGTVTDSAIDGTTVGGKRAGLAAATNLGNQFYFDNWSAADLSAGSAPIGAFVRNSQVLGVGIA